MKPRLALRAAALVVAALATTACGKITVPAYLNIDQSAGANAISIDLTQTFGTTLVIPLVGGIHGKITVDTSKLFSSPDGIFGTIVGDQITIAGENTSFLGLPTGTLCVRQDPNTPTTGTVLIRLDDKSKVDLNFAAQATSSLVKQLVASGILPLQTSADDVPLHLDWSKLLKLNLNGAITTAPVVQGTLPADLPLIGGAPYTLEVHLTSSTKAATDALLSDPTCVDFQAGN